MKMKRILLVTFLLLVVLTIGAASAEDNNATSDDLQVADEGDDVVELDYDSDYHEITPCEDEMCIDEDDDDYYDESVVDIMLPKNARGNVTVFNGKVKVAETAISKTDDHWEFDDEDAMGSLYLEDFNLTKIHDGDNLTFMFFELKNSQYVPVNGLTVTCKVSLKDSVLLFYDISNAEGDESDNEGILEVSDMDLNNTDENFTYVYVAEKDGIFRITINPDENNEWVIFEEYLKNSERKYVPYKDEDDEVYYKFGFSLTDINNFLAQKYDDINSLKDLIDADYLSSGDEMYFELVEDDEDETDMDSITMIVTIADDKISFKEEDDEEDVYVDYDDENLKNTNTNDNLNETVILTYMVKEGITGRIVICLNDNQTPAFEKSLSDMKYDDYDDGEEVYSYDITIADLNITQAGEYVLHCYFYDETDNQICEYDEDDLETLILGSSQIITGDNVTIEFIGTPIRVDEDKTIFRINATDGQDDDEIIIYVDNKDEPIIIKFKECEVEGDNVYLITSQQLDLGVGQHTINITCKGSNFTGVINITSDLEIDFADDVVYTSFNDPFVFISLKVDDITESKDITGLVNVTLIDSEGNVLPTLQIDIEYMIDSDEDSYLIRPSNVGVDLNGTYAVSVIYYNGTKGFVQAEGNVTFKAVGSADYGVSISDKIVDDRIITFNDVPFDNNILVEIDDGDRLVPFEKSSLSRGLDSQNKTIYFISQDQLNLTDGSHSIKVSIENGFDTIELANVNVTVDLKENADPALTVSVANIEVGNAATVLITTNSSFTGNVKVQVANKTYDVNVTNGQGNVSVTGLDVGEYIATATFEADAFFNASVKTAAFNVTAKPVTPGKENTTPVTPAKEDTKPVAKKTKVKLTLKKVKVKRSAKKLVLTATLKINGKAAKKKKIIFKFKGKKYKAKTNKKGVAKVTIKKKVLIKLKKGKKVKIQASYGKTVKKYTVKVRK